MLNTSLAKNQVVAMQNTKYITIARVTIKYKTYGPVISIIRPT